MINWKNTKKNVELVSLQPKIDVAANKLSKKNKYNEEKKKPDNNKIDERKPKKNPPNKLEISVPSSIQCAVMTQKQNSS